MHINTHKLSMGHKYSHKKKIIINTNKQLYERGRYYFWGGQLHTYMHDNLLACFSSACYKEYIHIYLGFATLTVNEFVFNCEVYFGKII